MTTCLFTCRVFFLHCYLFAFSVTFGLQNEKGDLTNMQTAKTQTSLCVRTACYQIPSIGPIESTDNKRRQLVWLVPLFKYVQWDGRARLNSSAEASLGWSGGAKVLGNLPVPGRPTGLDYSRARACCACSRCGWGLFGHFFSHLSFLFSFSPSLGDGPI